MTKCKVCKTNKSHYVFQNKTVCFHCDELLFDMEIELEEEKSPEKSTGVLHISKSGKNALTVKK